MQFTLFSSWLLLDVGLNVEVGEEGEEEGAKEEEEGNIDLWVVTVHEQRSATMRLVNIINILSSDLSMIRILNCDWLIPGVDAPSDELNQLHAGDVLLPPEILLNTGTEAAHEVVEVHDNMNTNV